MYKIIFVTSSLAIKLLFCECINLKDFKNGLMLYKRTLMLQCETGNLQNNKILSGRPAKNPKTWTLKIVEWSLNGRKSTHSIQNEFSVNVWVY